MKPTIEMKMQVSLSLSALLLRQLKVSTKKMFWHTLNFPGIFFHFQQVTCTPWWLRGEHLTLSPRWPGCMDRYQNGAAAGAGMNHRAASFPFTDSCLTHFLLCSLASCSWLSPGSWIFMIKSTKSNYEAQNWTSWQKRHQCYHSDTSPCLKSFNLAKS